MIDFKENGLWKKSKFALGVQKRTTCGRMWDGMLARCTLKHQQRNTAYAGCYMAEEFKDFQFFVEWCHKQVGFGEQGYSLDKDLLVPGNRCYGPDTCVFIPRSLNNFIIKKSRKLKTLPIGVEYEPRKPNTPYKACVYSNGRTDYLGFYTTVEEARSVYIKAKEELRSDWIQRLADGVYPVDSRVIEALKTVELY